MTTGTATSTQYCPHCGDKRDHHPSHHELYLGCYDCADCFSTWEDLREAPEFPDDES